jgi:hypothetical protein
MAGKPLPIACQFDKNDIPGIFGGLVGPPNPVGFKSITPTVLAGGRSILTEGALLGPHGNWQYPKLPGYNPLCKATEIDGMFSVTVFAGKGMLPVAMTGGTGIGSVCICGHQVVGPGMPTVLVGK